MVKPKPKVNNPSLGGLNPNLIYTPTGKLPRAAGNLSRNKALAGYTVAAALASGLINAAGIKYDAKLGFITLNKPKGKAKK
tara:strand:+ start:1304 stop:1546 length:243 start_codon:yes stop_codon:yes gene_type:complete